MLAEIVMKERRKKEREEKKKQREADKIVREAIRNEKRKERELKKRTAEQKKAQRFLERLQRPGSRFHYNPLEGFESAVLGRSESGWMDSELFASWLHTVFIPHVNRCAVKKPLVLFVDGHSTQLTLDACNACIDNNIILYCLPAHASHVIQPLDLSLFSSLKHTWRQAVRQYQDEHVGENVTKAVFARVFRGTWELSATAENAIKGFNQSGLFPFNKAKVISSLKLAPSNVFGDQTRETMSSPSHSGIPRLPSCYTQPL